MAEGDNLPLAPWEAQPTAEPPIAPVPAMPSSEKEFRDMLKKSEGYTPRASWDYKQYSVGYGSKARYPNEVIDRPEAERRLDEDIASARKQVDQFDPNLPEGPRDALTSLTFNSGSAWMGAGLGDAVKRGDWEDAKRRFLLYNKAGGRENSALVARRAQEVTLFDRPNRAVAMAPQESPLPPAPWETEGLSQTPPSAPETPEEPPT